MIGLYACRNMFDGEALRFPVREALLQTKRIAAVRPQQSDGLVREHAVRTPAVRYDSRDSSESP
jgi:hypothetical protein